jgi:hypothetical protein
VAQARLKPHKKPIVAAAIHHDIMIITSLHGRKHHTVLFSFTPRTIRSKFVLYVDIWPEYERIRRMDKPGADPLLFPRHHPSQRLAAKPAFLVTAALPSRKEEGNTAQKSTRSNREVWSFVGNK